MKTRFSRQLLRTKTGQRNTKKRQFQIDALEDRRVLATNVLLGSVDQFSSPADLNLQPARVAYAINFSNNDPDLNVSGVIFQHDRQAIPGATLVGPNNVTPWQTTPNFGVTADDNNLEQVMGDIRWATAPGQQVSADLDVVPGRDYRLQLLISGNHAESRIWDISVEGQLAVDEISSLGVQPGATYANNRSTVYSYEFTAADTQLNVAMGGMNQGANDGGDRNAIWQGLLLSDITHDFVWSGQGDGVNWTDAGNWSSVSGIPGVPGAADSVAFANADVGQVDLQGAARQVASVTFENVSGVFNLQNGTLIAGSIDQTSSGHNVISAALDASGNALAGSISDGSLRLESFANSLGANDTLTVTGGKLIGVSGGGNSLGSASVVLDGGTLSLDSNVAAPTVLGGITGNLELWLDSSDLDGDGSLAGEPGEGDRVTTWADKSGNAHHANNVTGSPFYARSSAGANGLPVVGFDGDDKLHLTDSLYNTMGLDYTIFSVARYSGGANQRIISSQNQNWLFGYWSGSDERWYAEGWVQQTGGSANTNLHYHSGTMQAAADPPANFWKDGSQLTFNGLGSGNAPNQYRPGQLTLGGWQTTEFSNAEVAEVIIYDSLLSAAERLEVETYLASKYGIGTAQPGSAATDFSSTNVTVNSDSAIEMTSRVTESSIGSITVNNGATLGIGGRDQELEISGALTVNGNSTITVSNADLHLSGGAAIGANAVTLTGDTNIQLASSVAGSGGLTMTGDVSLTSTGNNTWDPAIAAGNDLTVTSTSGTLTINGDIDLGNWDLTFDGAGDVVVAGDVSGGLASGTLVSYEQAALALGAAGYYSFDAVGNGTVFNSGSAGVTQDGRLTGGASVTGGLLGQGLSSPASTNVFMLNNNGIDVGADGWTASIWFNDINPTGQWRTLLRGVTIDHQIIVETSSFRLGVYDHANGAFRPSGYNDVSPVDDGQWHHIVARGSAGGPSSLFGTTDFFLDGVHVGTSDRRSLSELTTIGNLVGGGQPFGSLLDEVALYQRPLSDAEIAALSTVPTSMLDLSLLLSNDVTKNGTGNVTLSGNNSYRGETLVNEGVLVAASSNALGDAAAGTSVADGATLATSGTGNVLGDDVTVQGSGLLVNQSGDNEIAGTVTHSGGLQFDVLSLAGTLTLSNSVSLGIARLQFDGAGNVVVSGDISGSVAADGSIPGLGNILGELEVWLDAADIDGNGTPDALADGAAVNSWVDKSGQGRNFDNVLGDPNYTLSSTHGGPAVNFDGDDALRMNLAHNPRQFIDGNGEFTLISVARYSGPTRARVIAATSSHNWLFGFHGGSTNRFHFDNWGSLDATVGNINDTNWHLHSNRQNLFNDVTNPAGDFYRDGVLVTNDGRGTADSFANNVPDGLSLGAYNGLGEASTAEVSELIMYNRVLSEAELQIVEYYLSQKYSLGFSALSLSNDVVKSGSGTVTLSGNNTYLGHTFVDSGVLVVASSQALGDPSEGTTVVDGATLGISGNTTLSNETIVLNGLGDLSQPGALVNVSGNNTIDASVTLRAETVSMGQIGIGSVDDPGTAFADTLTIDADVNLLFSLLTVNGSGNVVVNGTIESNPGALPVSLENLEAFASGDYSTAAGGQTFDSLVDDDGTNSWLLVGRGREGWDFDQNGPNSDPNLVNDSLGTPAAFAPTAFSDVIINDLLAQSGLNMSNIVVRLKRAANVAGSEYQEYRWSNFPVSRPTWTWDFDDGGQYAGITAEAIANAAVGFGAGVNPNVNTRDGEAVGGNHWGRVFTWPWASHNSQRGFSYGSAIAGTDNNSPTSFLWEFTTENHSIPYTEVYIRSTSAPSFTADNQLIKTGTGTLTLTAANTYSGNTTVNGGALLAANTGGSATGAGNVNVIGSGILGGNGTVSGAVGVTAGGVISPGFALGDANTLNTGSLTVTSTGISFGEITSTGNDTVVVTGSVDVTNANGALTLEDDFRPPNGTVYTLIDNDGVDPIVGLLSNGGGGNLAEGDTFTITHLVGGISRTRQFQVSYLGGDGNDLVLTFIQRAPVATDQSFNINEDGSLSDAVDTADADNDTMTVSLDTGPANAAAFTLNPDGTFTYSPTANFSGSDSFTYTVTDGELTDTGTVTITIAPIADGVTLTLGDIGGPNNENTAIGFPIGIVKLDDDGSETYVVTISGLPAAAVLSAGTNNGGGNWTLTEAQIPGLTVTQDDGPNPLSVSAITVSVLTTDTDGLAVPVTDTITDTGMLNYTIDNSPPAPTITGPSSGVPGFTLDFTYAANDPSATDQAATFDYVINWGDGNMTTIPGGASTGMVQYVYPNFGNFTITIFATDKDGETNLVAGMLPIDIVPVALIGDDIYAGGTGAADRIIFYPTNGGIQVRYNQTTYPSPSTSFPVNASTRLVAFGQGSSDYITAAGNVNLPAVFDGGDSNDYLSGGTQDDTLIGGAGNDVILAGEGNNLIIGDNRDGTGIGIDRLEGRSGQDTIFGGAGSDRLNGGAGDDILDGGDGHDFVMGGLGNDLIQAGNGNDTVQGYYGHDIILGGDALDQLFGGGDDDLLIGGDGLDRVRGDSGNDVVAGGTSALDDDIAADLAAMLATEGGVLGGTVAAAVNAWFTTRDRTLFGLVSDAADIDDLTGDTGDDIFYGPNDMIRDFRSGDTIL